VRDSAGPAVKTPPPADLAGHGRFPYAVNETGDGQVSLPDCLRGEQDLSVLVGRAGERLGELLEGVGAGDAGCDLALGDHGGEAGVQLDESLRGCRAEPGRSAFRRSPSPSIW
jgi:hypothetical protein